MVKDSLEELSIQIKQKNAEVLEELLTSPLNKKINKASVGFIISVIAAGIGLAFASTDIGKIVTLAGTLSMLTCLFLIIRYMEQLQ